MSNFTEEVQDSPPLLERKLDLSNIKSLSMRGIRDRKITKHICEFYGVRVSFNAEGIMDAHYYPYDNETAFKKRELPKKFSWYSMSYSLFGQDKFSAGGKRLIITEGEIDALTIAQASYDKYQKIYPAVALSSATIAEKLLLENRDWIRSFKEVVLCFDEDERGQEALAKAIKIIGQEKSRITKLNCKDANELYLKSGADALLSAVFNAETYLPSGIISKEDLWAALEAYNEIESLPYPECVMGLNGKLKGLRFGEIVLLVSGTGSGKSTMCRELMLHISKTTDDKCGIISLEESPAETARKLSGMELKKNPAKEEIPLDELKIGFDKVFGDDKFVVLDHQGSISDDSIIDKLEYMCLVGCKYLFIDHITILVSEGVNDLTGNEAQDKMMNQLLGIVKRHNVCIILISHLRKTPSKGKSFEEGAMPSLDDIKGSGSIKQISFDIIAFTRNMVAVNEIERNTIKMRVLKSRYTGLTGDVRGARYDYDTGRLYSLESDVVETFVEE